MSDAVLITLIIVAGILVLVGILGATLATISKNFQKYPSTVDTVAKRVGTKRPPGAQE